MVSYRTVTIKVRYSDFNTITRSHTYDYTVCDDDSIFNTGWRMFSQLTPAPIRLLGIGVSNLSNTQQLSLFENTVETGELAQIMDTINEKFKKHALTKGRTLSRLKDEDQNKPG